mmetsp:Transcript_38351/g.95179  ORF Transcript_38351/g.95179 Transcript_38351/m.95179 type:complete len:245 (-) Transcript_38351:114-848(-)
MPSSGTSICLKRGFLTWFTHMAYLKSARESCSWISPLSLAYSSAVCSSRAVLRSSTFSDRARTRAWYPLSWLAASALSSASAQLQYSCASCTTSSLSCAVLSASPRSCPSPASTPISYPFTSFSCCGSGLGLHALNRSHSYAVLSWERNLSSTFLRSAWNGANSAASAASRASAAATRSSSSVLSPTSSNSRSFLSSSSIFRRSSSKRAASSSAANSAASSASFFLFPPFLPISAVHGKAVYSI